MDHLEPDQSLLKQTQLVGIRTLGYEPIPPLSFPRLPSLVGLKPPLAYGLAILLGVEGERI